MDEFLESGFIEVTLIHSMETEKEREHQTPKQNASPTPTCFALLTQFQIVWLITSVILECGIARPPLGKDEQLYYHTFYIWENRPEMSLSQRLLSRRGVQKSL